MPLYDYRAIEGGCEYCADAFEIIEKRGAERIAACPECGVAVTRLLSGCSVGKSTALAKKHLEKAGFTTYNKAGKDNYERTSGSDGPSHIVRNE